MNLLSLTMLTALLAAPQDDQDDANGAPLANDAAAIEALVNAALDRRLGSRPAGQLENQFSRLTFYGDLRLRHESSFHRDGQDDQHRERLRLRLGINYEIDPQLLFGTRFATGDPDSPGSPHITLGDSNDNIEFAFDRVFLSYHPDRWHGTNLTVGKFAAGFTQNPIFSELSFDADLQQEGALLEFPVAESGPHSVSARIGQFWLLENGSNDAAHTALELRGRTIQAPFGSLRTSVAYHHFQRLTPDGELGFFNDNAGNATRDTDGDGVADDFLSGFRLVDANASVSRRVFGHTLTIGGQYVHNLRAETDRDQAWAAGISIGDLREPGDIRWSYNWQVVEQDAVLSALAQDDFLLSTNFRGHVFGLDARLTDAVSLQLWSLITSREHRGNTRSTDSDRWQGRLRLDLNIKF